LFIVRLHIAIFFLIISVLIKSRLEAKLQNLESGEKVMEAVCEGGRYFSV